MMLCKISHLIIAFILKILIMKLFHMPSNALLNHAQKLPLFLANVGTTLPPHPQFDVCSL